MTTFSDRLTSAIREKKTPVLVGLDPRWEQLPSSFTEGKDGMNPQTVADAFEQFCRIIIDLAAPLVPAVKPQSAFFEQYGPLGMVCLERVIRYAKDKGLLVLFDGKRNDIGSTAAAYASGILGPGSLSYWGADALTVNPYMGDDSLAPFVKVANERDAGVFVLVKTSNPGGALFQDLKINNEPLYSHVARYVEKIADESRIETHVKAAYGNVGAVVGATWPEQLVALRSMMPHAWFLVPGYGSQGGAARDVAGAFDDQGLGALINNSRGIIFAYRNAKYAERFGEACWENAVESAILDMKAALAAETSTGRL